ncbi:MAG: Jag N-terminal domain-containing protein [Candidatus Omnitrophota bacterium]
MESIEVEGKTVEEAIEEALKLLNTTRDNIEVTVVREGKNGLFGMPGAILTKIRVTKKKK